MHLHSPLIVGETAASRATTPLCAVLAGVPAMKADAEVRRAAKMANFIVFGVEKIVDHQRESGVLDLHV